MLLICIAERPSYTTRVGQHTLEHIVLKSSLKTLAVSDLSSQPVFGPLLTG